MRTVSVTWDKEGARFIASGTYAGHTVAINTPKAPGETRAPTGFSATELLLAGAGACSAWDVVEILRKRRSEISSLDVVVEGEQQDDPPWTYRRVALHYRIAGEGMTYGVMARVVRLSIARYCSVITTIAAAAAIEATVELVNGDGTSTGRKHVELALPYGPGVVAEVTEHDLEVIGVPEPAADEEDE